MKKLLCLLLSVLSVLFLIACDSRPDEYTDEGFEYTTVSNEAESAYEDAIRLTMKALNNDATKEELLEMVPEELWDALEEKNGKTLDDVYEEFSAKIETYWLETRKEYGDNVSVKYEIINRNEINDSELLKYKNELERKFGIDPTKVGIVYEVMLKQAIVGQLKETIFNQTYYVVELDGDWFVTAVLSDILGL